MESKFRLKPKSCNRCKCELRGDEAVQDEGDYTNIVATCSNCGNMQVIRTVWHIRKPQPPVQTNVIRFHARLIELYPPMPMVLNFGIVSA